jgi:hypothetical protein
LEGNRAELAIGRQIRSHLTNQVPEGLYFPATETSIRALLIPGKNMTKDKSS